MNSCEWLDEYLMCDGSYRLIFLKLTKKHSRRLMGFKAGILKKILEIRQIHLAFLKQKCYIRVSFKIYKKEATRMDFREKQLVGVRLWKDEYDDFKTLCKQLRTTPTAKMNELVRIWIEEMHAKEEAQK